MLWKIMGFTDYGIKKFTKTKSPFWDRTQTQVVCLFV